MFFLHSINSGVVHLFLFKLKCNVCSTMPAEYYMDINQINNNNQQNTQALVLI